MTFRATNQCRERERRKKVSSTPKYLAYFDVFHTRQRFLVRAAPRTSHLRCHRTNFILHVLHKFSEILLIGFPVSLSILCDESLVILQWRCCHIWTWCRKLLFDIKQNNWLLQNSWLYIWDWNYWHLRELSNIYSHLFCKYLKNLFGNNGCVHSCSFERHANSMNWESYSIVVRQ